MRRQPTLRTLRRSSFSAALIAAATSNLALANVIPVPTVEMDKYLLIGTTSNDIAKAVNVQNGDLGADVVVLSTDINDNVDLNLNDVFLNNAGSVWVDANDTANDASDTLPGGATVGEGVSWTGDVALTSPNAKFDMSNVELYGQVGVVADAQAPPAACRTRSTSPTA